MTQQFFYYWYHCTQKSAHMVSVPQAYFRLFVSFFYIYIFSLGLDFFHLLGLGLKKHTNTNSYFNENIKKQVGLKKVKNTQNRKQNERQFECK